MIELRTLGDCQIVAGDERLGPQSPFAFALALFLAIERGRPHSRDELVAMFLPGVPEQNASHSLRQTLYKLRQLGVPAETTPAGTVIPASAVRDDYTALLATHELPDPRSERLPGEFLPGYWPKISDEFARWLEAQRDAVNGALRRAYVARILDRRAVARWDEVERFARACLVVDPLNEEATLALAEALALSGSKAAAVRLLDKYVEEIGAEPGVLALPASVLKRRISERYQFRTPIADVPVFGRDDEMRELNEHLLAARAGQRAVVWMFGEPGIGKTRLASDFISLAVLTGARIVSSGCQPHDARRTLGIWIDVLAGLLDLPGALGCSQTSLALLRGLARGEAPASEPHLTDNTQGHPRSFTASVVSALDDLFSALSAEAVIVIAIDDVHWADPASLSVLEHFLATNSTQRLLMVVCARLQPPVTPTGAGPLYVRHLKGITQANGEELVRMTALRVNHELPPDAIERAAMLGAGNPFFLRALAQHLICNPGLTTLPSRLTDILEQRIRSASPTAETILIACALLGPYAGFCQLESVLQIPRFRLAAELGALERASLIVAHGDRVSITHAIITESVIQSMSRSSRALVHRSCAETLESLARSTGSLATYWAAHDCWLSYGNNDDALRCATDACTLDALRIFIRSVDTAAGRDAVRRLENDESEDRPPHQRISRPEPTTTPLLSPDHQPDPEWLLAIARDSSQSTATRLRAAVATLSLAEYSCNAELATRAYDAATSAGASATGDARSDLVRATLAYHTVFGDQRTALRVATEQEARSLRHAGRLCEVRSAINAAEAFTRCGEWRRGLTLLDIVYRTSMEQGLSAVAMHCPIRATWIARHVNLSFELSIWRERCRLTAAPDSIAYPSYLYNEALLALDAGEVPQGQALIRALRDRASGKHSRYHHALMDAAEVRATVMAQGGIDDESRVDELHEWSLMSAAVTPEDDVAIAVCLARISTHGAEAGRAYSADYMRSRRTTTYAPSLQLIELLATL